MSRRFFNQPADQIVPLVAKHLPVLVQNASDQLQQIVPFVGPVEELVKVYVEPTAQNLNPADLADDDTGMVAATPIFQMLDRFLSNTQKYTHAFILSDAGMGKSSLLGLIKLASINGIIDSNINVHLIKLGDTTEAELKPIQDFSNTILLLDALDEDSQARGDFYARIQQILRLTQHFKRTIITCRSQFFPDHHEKDPSVPGLVVLHGFRAALVFLSPFSDEQVDVYLNKKFPDEQERQKAESIVFRMKSLKFRPMLLAYVDFLIDRNDDLRTQFDVFHALVDEWLNREQRKLSQDVKPLLYETCRLIAMSMYRENKDRINQSRLDELCTASGASKKLDEMTIEGRSLLQKTSEKLFKFAHYSILEYFVARTLLKTPEALKTTDQIKQFLVDQLDRTPNVPVSSLDLSKIRLSGSRLPSFAASKTDFTGASFTHVILHNSSFVGANLKGSKFEECNLRKVNLSEAVLDGTRLSNCDITDTVWRGCETTSLQLNRCVAKALELSQIEFHVKDWTQCELEAIKFTDVTWRGGPLLMCHFKNGIIQHCTLSQISLNRSRFENVDLISTDLSRSKLEGAYVQKCSWSEVNLSQATVEELVIEEVAFDKCDLSGITGTGFKLERSHFTRVSLNGVKLEGAHITNCRFSEVDFGNSDFTQSKLQNVTYVKCNLAGSRWLGTSFHDCDLSDATLKNLNFHKASFRRSSLRDANLEHSDLSEASFVEVALHDADFGYANLTGCDFSGHDLTRTNLGNAKVQSARFARCRIQRLSGFNLQNADFREANLEGASLDRCNLLGTNFNDSLLNGAQCISARMEHCSLARAKLRGVILDRANVFDVDARGADFTEAKCGGTVFTNVRYDETTVMPPNLTVDQRAGWVLTTPNI